MRALVILLAGLALGWISLAGAVQPAPAPLAAPPPMPAASETTPGTAAPTSSATATAATPPATSAAGSQSKVAAGSNARSTLGESGEPSALEQLPPAHPIASDTRIEQIRHGNRVAEIRVTPAGSSRSYVIVTREPSRQYSLQDSGSGLSTPRFVRIEF